MTLNVSQAVARVYAQALSDLGEDEGSLPRIADDLHALRALYETDAKFREFFASPRLDPPTKKRVLSELLSEKIGRPAMGLLHVLVDKQRETLLDNIADEFDRYRDLREGRLHVHITAARPVDEDQLDVIRSRLEKVTGKKILAHVRIDQRVLGGLRIKVGDKVIDGTLRRRLRQLRHALVPTRN